MFVRGSSTAKLSDSGNKSPTSVSNAHMLPEACPTFTLNQHPKYPTVETCNPNLVTSALHIALFGAHRFLYLIALNPNHKFTIIPSKRTTLAKTARLLASRFSNNRKNPVLQKLRLEPWAGSRILFHTLAVGLLDFEVYVVLALRQEPDCSAQWQRILAVPSCRVSRQCPTAEYPFSAQPQRIPAVPNHQVSPQCPTTEFPQFSRKHYISCPIRVLGGDARSNLFFPATYHTMPWKSILRTREAFWGLCFDPDVSPPTLQNAKMN